MNEQLIARLHSIEYELKVMESYLKKSKEHLDTLTDSTFRNYLAEFQSNIQFPNLNIDLQHKENTYMNTIRFPQLHYSSFVITLYSLIESELIEFCILCKKEYKLNSSIKKIKGLDSAKHYIDDKMLTQFDSSLWFELKGLSLLRNKIVHLGPRFDRKLLEYEKIELKQFIKKHKLMRDYQYKLLYIDYNFCLYLIQFTRDFFNVLYNNTILKYEYSK